MLNKEREKKPVWNKILKTDENSLERFFHKIIKTTAAIMHKMAKTIAITFPSSKPSALVSSSFLNNKYCMHKFTFRRAISLDLILIYIKVKI